MMNTKIESFNQKVSLIYEYNSQTPLFVRVAWIEIEKNNLDNAINILTKGLENFPDNPVACLLLGKIYTIKGDYNEALNFIKQGSELIHSIKTFNHYISDIETIKKQRSFFNVSRWANLSEEQSKLTDENINHQQPISNDEIEETLTRLTAEIEGAEKTLNDAKSKIANSKVKSDSKSDYIISETLAKIYASQNEFQAAISMYRKLIKKYPDKEKYYLSKIDELKSSLND